MVYDSGEFKVKDTGRKGESDISMSDWLKASAMMVDLFALHQSIERSQALREHNAIVVDLCHTTKSWELAVKYDIQSREHYTADKSIDLSVRNEQLISDLMRAKEGEVLKQLEAHVKKSHESSPLSITPNRLQRRTSFKPPPPYERPASTLKTFICYRCGHSGHLVRDCNATNTTAGKACATKNKLGHLIAPSGATYCTSFLVQNTCKNNEKCSYVHECPICGSSSHGGSECSSSK